ncbi:GNAT family N-acetyltransferase [Geminicoccus flavidas]|uniref:GNAT family N-acetyltransferase n=1 Tax=Geminicoccus flavidas TaxID=2506407 RepID=UPI00135AE4CF|nr:GNAT family N-acetyltransferase [Geminicoccus flavidas]
MSSTTIMPARSPEDIAAAARLFRAYAASLSVDLAYQDFAAELAGLPGGYAPPAGAVLLARDKAGQELGCVALRPLDPPSMCEMKRLYVAPAGRGLGLGRALVEAALAAARAAGYRGMRLDTLPDMTAAIALYRQMGFRPIPAYYETPVAGTLFLGRPLQDDADS